MKTFKSVIASAKNVRQDSDLTYIDSMVFANDQQFVNIVVPTVLWNKIVENHKSGYIGNINYADGYNYSNNQKTAMILSVEGDDGKNYIYDYEKDNALKNALFSLSFQKIKYRFIGLLAIAVGLPFCLVFVGIPAVIYGIKMVFFSRPVYKSLNESKRVLKICAKLKELIPNAIAIS